MTDTDPTADGDPNRATRHHDTGDEDQPSDAEGTLGAFNRRDYLRTVGAAGVAGLLGAAGGSGSAAAQSNWEAEADQRIQQNRTGDLQVVVRDGSGNPVSGVSVDVQMTEHDFGFGTAVNAGRLLNTSENDPYRENLRELFNIAVLENQHKWRFWEDNRQAADQTVDWLLDNGFRIRGHACVWGSRDAAAIPQRIEQAIDQRNADTIIRESMDHIEEIISYYGDDIEEWDVVNEAMHALDLQVGVYGDQINTDEPWTGDVVPWYSDLLADWYQQAQQVADQYGVGIAVNDFNTLNGWDYTTTWYPEQIDHLLDNGIDIDTIGFQGHIEANTGEPFTNESPDERLTYDQINELLDIYGQYDIDLAVTEFDTFQGQNWQGDQEKADVLRRYMKALYGHPNGSAFLMWGFWDGEHWGDDYGQQPDAPLFYQDWSPKPAYDVWTGLIFDEWWTDESGTTDSSGTFTATAYLGEHEVTVTTSEGQTTEIVSVTDTGGATVQITVDGNGTGGCDDGIQVGDYCATDPNGDGKYTDVNGNGGNDFDDVVSFFDEMNSDGVQNNVSAFDFNDNGGIDFDDVVALFNQV